MFFPAIDSNPSSTQPITLNMIPTMNYSTSNGEAVSTGSYPMQRTLSGQSFLSSQPYYANQSIPFGVSSGVGLSTGSNQSTNMGLSLISSLSSHTSSSSSSHLPPVSSNFSVVLQQVGFDKNAYYFYDLPECQV